MVLILIEILFIPWNSIENTQRRAVSSDELIKKDIDGGVRMEHPFSTSRINLHFKHNRKLNRCPHEENEIVYNIFNDVLWYLYGYI